MSRIFVVGVIAALAATAAAKKPAAVVGAGPQPALAPAPKWQAPVPTSALLANGLRTVMLEQHSLPLVHIVVTAQAGAELDPPGKSGLAAAVGDMLEEGGAGGMTGPELAEAFEALGDQLRIFTDRDGTTVAVTVQKRDAARAVQLIADLFEKPRFDEAEWTRFRARRLAEVVHRRDEPRFIADDVFDRMVFGDKHPYGQTVSGTQASLSKLSIADVRDFHAKHFGPKTTAILLVGDVTAKDDLTAPFKTWDSAAAPAPLPPAADPTLPRFVLVDRPGAPQSEVRVGHLGVARSTPDYAAMSLLEMVLGGSFTSRLNQNLREKHGYTYGVRARFVMENAPGPFVVQTAVRTDVTAPALKEILSELDGIRAPLTADELKKARALVLDGLIEGFGGGQDAAELLADVVRHNLPLDTYRTLPAQLDGLDVPALTAVAARLFQTQRVVVVVGDRKTLEPTLKTLAVAKAIELRDADGNLVQLETKLHPLSGRPAPPKPAPPKPAPPKPAPPKPAPAPAHK